MREGDALVDLESLGEAVPKPSVERLVRRMRRIEKGAVALARRVVPRPLWACLVGRRGAVGCEGCERRRGPRRRGNGEDAPTKGAKSMISYVSGSTSYTRKTGLPDAGVSAPPMNVMALAVVNERSE